LIFCVKYATLFGSDWLGLPLQPVLFFLGSSHTMSKLKERALGRSTRRRHSRRAASYRGSYGQCRGCGKLLFSTRGDVERHLHELHRLGELDVTGLEPYRCPLGEPRRWHYGHALWWRAHWRPASAPAASISLTLTAELAG
jgi:hypothetical protein